MALDPGVVAEMFSVFGAVRCRRMFGGTGVYADDVMFALESGGVLRLKADESTQAAYRDEGCGPFSYETRDGRRTVMSYWRVPERLLDEQEELAAWSRRALDIARAAKGRSRPKTGPRPR
jgi:DNA transformation protein